MYNPQVQIISAVIRGNVSDPIEMTYNLAIFARLLGLTTLQTAYAIFPSNGCGASIISTEAELTLRTWPETSRAIVTLSTCGQHVEPKKFVNLAGDAWGYDAWSVPDWRAYVDAVAVPPVPGKMCDYSPGLFSQIVT